MAISSAGIGSGLDVAKIVEQMVAAEKTPLRKLEVRADSVKTQISTYGEIKSLTSKLGDIVSKLTRDSAWNGVNISSSNTTLSGTMTGIASPGTYSIKVTQLAQAQTTIIGSEIAAALAKDETMDSSGKMTLTMGATIKEIDISSADTLSKIAVKVNEAGMGIQASVITDVDGKERLMLRSKETGTDKAFSVTIDPALSKLGQAEAQPAGNARIELNGVQVESSSNTFANTVPGMSFTATELTTNTATLTVKLDTEGMKKNIQEFVEAYNALNELLAKSTKAVRTADGKMDEAAQLTGSGILQGDSATVSLQNSLRMLTMGISGSNGAYKNLSSIGIQMLEGGTLSIDNTKLDKALTSVDDLKGLFANKADGLGQNGGIAVNFKNLTDKLLAYDGTLNSKDDALQKVLKSNSDAQNKVNERAMVLEERLYKQYTALDVKMASLNSLSTYVTQMVTNWNKSK
ncbi:MAG: flagellar filament capping protein FliD [Comamonas sp.]|nr:flagellar filament capping protein FliD [Comamonas sp.]